MRKLWNEGWQFVKLPLGSAYADMRAAEKQPVLLPHDWLIAQTEDLYESGGISKLFPKMKPLRTACCWTLTGSTWTRTCC